MGVAWGSAMKTEAGQLLGKQERDWQMGGGVAGGEGDGDR